MRKINQSISNTKTKNLVPSGPLFLFLIEWMLLFTQYEEPNKHTKNKYQICASRLFICPEEKNVFRRGPFLAVRENWDFEQWNHLVSKGQNLVCLLNASHRCFELPLAVQEVPVFTFSSVDHTRRSEYIRSCIPNISALSYLTLDSTNTNPFSKEEDWGARVRNRRRVWEGKARNILGYFNTDRNTVERVPYHPCVKLVWFWNGTPHAFLSLSQHTLIVANCFSPTYLHLFLRWESNPQITIDFCVWVSRLFSMSQTVYILSSLLPLLRENLRNPKHIPLFMRVFIL